LSRRLRRLAGGVVAGGALLLGLSLPSYADTGTRTSSWTYDASGLIETETVEPDATQLRLDTTYTYDAFGNKTAVTVSSPATGDAAITPRTTSTTYDAEGRFPATVTNALGQSETRVYDPASGQLISQTGPNGLTSSWEYDGFGRKTLEVRPDGTRTSWSYEWCDGYNSGSRTGCPTLARYAIVTTPLASDGTTQIGPRTIQYMDALEREVRAETEGLDDQGSTSAIYVDTEYDNQGRVARKSLPYFDGGVSEWNSFTYDVLGRVVWETLPDESLVQIIYNGLSMTVVNNEVQFRTKVKNGQGQVVRSIDDDGFETEYEYDAFGNLSTVTDALGNETVFVYDQRGRKIQMSDPDKGVWTYTYDALGQLTTQTDAKGQVTTMSYDLLGRKVSQIAHEADGSVGQESGWVFDTASYGIGKLAQATALDSAGSTISQRTHSYDTLGRPFQTSISVEGGTAQTYTTQYDSYGRPAEVSYPSGFGVSYAYTALSELAEVRKASDDSLLWQAEAKDASRRLTQFTYGNGVTSQLAYDVERGWLVEVQASKDGTTLQHLTFQWDRLSNLQQRSDLTAGGYTETFAYDYLNRLTDSTVAGQDTVTLTYDAGGNILSKSDVGTYSYNASGPSSVRPHAVASITGGPAGDKNYLYDSNGNMISGDGRSLVWAAFDKPVSVARDGGTLSFAYDAEYQRVRQTLATGATKEYYTDPASGARAEMTTVVGGSEVDWTDYVMVQGQMIAAVYTQVYTGAAATTYTHYFHKDHLGSIQTITDEVGALVERLNYDAWGKRRYADGTAAASGVITSSTDRGFTGHEHLAAVALIHMNGRIYDPLIGRFLSADPHVQDPYDSQAYNRYAYVKNNPLAYTDPSGYFSIGKIFRTIVAIAVAVVLGHPEFALAVALKSAAAAAIIAGAAAGAIASGSLKGAVTGAISGGLFYGIGPLVEGMKLASDTAWMVGGALRAVAGGAISVMQGGEFGSGFLAAGLMGFIGPKIQSWNLAAKVVAGAVIGGIGSRISGGKFENGAITGAFTYLFSSGFGSGSKEPTLSKGTGGKAFVGGFFDYTIKGPVFQSYQRYIETHENAAYFTWDQSEALAAWIDTNGGAVSVVGHSWGGDMAAKVVASGHNVSSLTTVDPVSWARPDYSAVAANSDIWINLNATGGGANFANIIAGIGNAWNNAPTPYATFSRNINSRDHATVMGCWAAPMACP